MFTITFTEDERRVMIQMCDIVVRAQGLQAAQACLLISNKLSTSLPDEPKKDDTNETPSS